jgi:hypothetical protein
VQVHDAGKCAGAVERHVERAAREAGRAALSGGGCGADDHEHGKGEQAREEVGT